MELVDVLLKNGAMGLVAGVFMYLYLRERKANLEATKNFLEMQKDTVKTHLQVGHSLSDLTKAVDSIDKHAKADRTELKTLVERTAISRGKDVLDAIGNLEREQQQTALLQREFQIRMEERHGNTNPALRIPTGGQNEQG